MIRTGYREEARRRVERLDLSFDRTGHDRFGVSRDHLVRTLAGLLPVYRHYFRVGVGGSRHLPAEGPAVLVGNHAGGLPIDGAVLTLAVALETEPPRLAQAMIERFIPRLPYVGWFFARGGQLLGHPENARALLRHGRLLVVFPEGASGTAKTYRQRYQLRRFGTGFLRLALQAGAPVIPVGIAGAGDSIPVLVAERRLGPLIGAPYVPITPYGLPLPLPVRWRLEFGAPLRFDGDGTEDDARTGAWVEEVRREVAGLVALARSNRRRRWLPGRRT